jgi:hypothetical protein
MDSCDGHQRFGLRHRTNENKIEQRVRGTQIGVIADLDGRSVSGRPLRQRLRCSRGEQRAK